LQDFIQNFIQNFRAPIVVLQSPKFIAPVNFVIRSSISNRPFS